MRSAALLAVIAAVLAPARPAAACGGLFCDPGSLGPAQPTSTVPQQVEQTGERILFARDDQGRLLSYIQIAYDGPATQFSWVLPVVGNPDVSVGTDKVFDLLDLVTTPTVGIDWSYEGCTRDNTTASMACSKVTKASYGGGNEDPNPPVNPGYIPLGMGRSGPYDFAVLPGTSAQDAIDWLQNNGYYAPPRAADLLAPYVDGRHNFVALRLTAGAVAGDIVPVVVHSDEEQPCVPLRLTAVGAQQDMPVLVWILGQFRAVPQNYASVEPNLARLDFGQAGVNYDALLQEAVNAAPGGEGFVTQFAGKNPGFAGKVYVPERDEVMGFADESSAVQLVTDVQTWASDSGWNQDALIAVLGRWLPEPAALKASVEERLFYGSPQAYASSYASLSFDPGAIARDLDRTFVAPLRDTQALLDHRPYLTRLYTRISPEEMLDDPIFGENPDLPDVSNHLTASAHVVCEGKPSSQAPVRLDLPDGNTLWFASLLDAQLPLGGPAARRVLRLSTTGAGTAIVDNSATIDEGHGDPRGCGGCRSSAGGLPWALLCGVLVARSLLRRPR